MEVLGLLYVMHRPIWPIYAGQEQARHGGTFDSFY